MVAYISVQSRQTAVALECKTQRQKENAKTKVFQVRGLVIYLGKNL